MATSPETATRAERRPLAYTDEDVDRPLVQGMQLHGFDVLTAQEAGTLGQHDDEQLAYAASIGRVIVSYNRLDFRRWHRQFVQAGHHHWGIVLLPQDSPLPRRVIRACLLLDWLAALGQAEPRLLNWNDLQIRLQAGYRLPRYTEHDVRIALGRDDKEAAIAPGDC